MPGYTSEEVQVAIDQFLLGNVATPRTNLGVRDVLSARDDIFALLTTTLLLKPDSYFYVVWLAKNRLEALRRQQVVALEFILSSSTIAALGRRGKPVTSTVELVNAQAALLNLNAGLNQGQGTSTRTLGPEVTRFRSNIERFIRGELAPNVVEDGVPTETAGEIRTRISSLWGDVRTRHEEMLALCELIRDAVSNLSSVKLPEKAVREVVSRLQARLSELTDSLAADRTVSTHREAMLELLTMRTLLSRVSSFRTPQQLLAPLTGDSGQLQGVAGSAPAAITGTVSGPFNAGPGATLDFEAGSPVTASSIPLSRYSNAEVRSREFLTTPITFPATASLRLRVDGILYPDDATFGGASYATTALFAAAIQGYLTANAVPATVSVSGFRVLLRSDNELDDSSIEVLAGTAGQQNFLITAGFAQYAVCSPVPASTIISDATSHISVRLSEIRTDYFSGEGTTSAGGVIDISKSTGTVDTTGGGTAFWASQNLENAGVRAGDYISIDVFGSPQRTRIRSVLGASFTVDEEIADVGLVSYRAGADLRSVPAGARVIVGSSQVPLNSGPYRVVSSDVARLTLDRTFNTNADPVSLTVQTFFLQAAAAGATPADGITAWPASDGATAVGFTPSATQVKSAFVELEVDGTVDLLARGVTAGDQVTLSTTPPAVTVVESVGLSTLVVEPTPYFAGSTAYTIESARYLAWQELVSYIEDFLDDVDFEQADFAITRILSGAAPTALLGGGGPVSTFSATLTALSSIQEYVVPFERSVDNILRMLSEQGMDRAVDLFTKLEVIEFFSMHADGVSYATHLERTAADVTRRVAPVSRFAKSIIGSPEVRLRSRRMNSG